MEVSFASAIVLTAVATGQSSVKIINALISLYVHLQCFDILKRAIFVYMSFTKVDLDFGNSSHEITLIAMPGFYLLCSQSDLQ